VEEVRQSPSSKIVGAYERLQRAVEGIEEVVDTALGSPSPLRDKDTEAKETPIFLLIDSLPTMLHTLAESLERSEVRIKEAIF